MVRITRSLGRICKAHGAARMAVVREPDGLRPWTPSSDDTQKFKAPVLALLIFLRPSGPVKDTSFSFPEVDRPGIRCPSAAVIQSGDAPIRSLFARAAGLLTLCSSRSSPGPSFFYLCLASTNLLQLYDSQEAQCRTGMRWLSP